MGEAKRRKALMGDKYGQNKRILPWVPISKFQSEQFVKWSTTGAWLGIGLLVAYWLTIRFIGPALNLWQVN